MVAVAVPVGGCSVEMAGTEIECSKVQNLDAVSLHSAPAHFARSTHAPSVFSFMTSCVEYVLLAWLVDVEQKSPQGFSCSFFSSSFLSLNCSSPTLIIDPWPARFLNTHTRAEQEVHHATAGLHAVSPTQIPPPSNEQTGIRPSPSVCCCPLQCSC